MGHTWESPVASLVVSLVGSLVGSLVASLVVVVGGGGMPPDYTSTLLSKQSLYKHIPSPLYFA